MINKGNTISIVRTPQNNICNTNARNFLADIRSWLRIYETRGGGTRLNISFLRLERVLYLEKVMQIIATAQGSHRSFPVLAYALSGFISITANSYMLEDSFTFLPSCFPTSDNNNSSSATARPIALYDPATYELSWKTLSMIPTLYLQSVTKLVGFYASPNQENHSP